MIIKAENTKTVQRRLELRNLLIDIAEVQIGETGLSNLTAREMAKKAQCSVGAIYNVFEDMQQLILSVNIRTFSRMGVAIMASILPDDQQSPRQRLIDMSIAYLNFALDNKSHWKALFEIEMAEDKGLPPWYLEKTDDLFALIEIPVSKIYAQDRNISYKYITRTLFSCVHGIVALGVERRLMSTPVENLEGMITWMLNQTVK